MPGAFATLPSRTVWDTFQIRSASLVLSSLPNKKANRIAPIGPVVPIPVVLCCCLLWFHVLCLPYQDYLTVFEFNGQLAIEGLGNEVFDDGD
jgi:hypothetical protein